MSLVRSVLSGVNLTSSTETFYTTLVSSGNDSIFVGGFCFTNAFSCFSKVIPSAANDFRLFHCFLMTCSATSTGFSSISSLVG